MFSAVTNGPRISVAHTEPLASVFDSFVLMYANHAAREDTIVFPAWKKNFTNTQLDEISDQFEDIEHKMFGKDGFEDAEKKIVKSRTSSDSPIWRNSHRLHHPNPKGDLRRDGLPTASRRGIRGFSGLIYFFCHDQRKDCTLTAEGKAAFDR